ncbi:MAG: toxin-antitoxin system YwqK family antitoxin [Saprospiraceae bacterium]
MAADFMEHQAPYPGKWAVRFYLILMAFAIGCTSSLNDSVSPISAIKLHVEGDRTYLDDQLFTGRSFWLYEDTGDTAMIQSFLHGREHGLFKKYYKNGKPAELRQYVHGKKTGALITWWENGERQMNYQFKDDEYNGSCREWNELGMLIKEMHYKNGYEDGTQKVYSNDGKIKSNYVIKDGRRYGLLGTKHCINLKDSLYRS